MSHDPVVFREYDIRGVVGKDFDSTFAFELGRSYATLARKILKKDSLNITIGNDARISSNEIVSALADGLCQSGVNVFRLGLVTTPMTYFTTFYYPHIDGGIMVTGSHNPPDYNGFKLSIGKTTIFGEDIVKLKHIMQDKDFKSGVGKDSALDIFADYIERYKKEFKNLKPLPLTLDCGNGAAGCVARKLYEACGLKPKILFEEPDGRFPNHHPDPTVEKNLQSLIKTVREDKAALGIGFDGDCDRIGIVDDGGRIILGDELMVLVAQDLLQTEKGLKIIGDVKCSDRMYAAVEKMGGNPIMWKTGHSLIKQKIKDEKAPFGGELSGHIFFNDRNYGYDDALYAGLRIVEILSKTGKTISQLLSDLPTAFYTPEIRIDTTEEKKLQIVSALKDKYTKILPSKQINTLDGIRITFNDGWALARASNTQPVIVLRFESQTEAGLKKLQSEIQGYVESLV